MPFDLSNLGRHLLASRHLLAQRTVQVIIVLAAALIFLSLLLAPEDDPGGWDWFRIVLISLLAATSLLLFTSSQDHSQSLAERQQQLMAAGALVILALILNLTFSFGTTVVFSIGISAIALMVVNTGTYRNPRTIGAALAALIPFWIWAALEAWTAGLLLLVPLGLIALVTDSHMRLSALPDSGVRRLSRRGHRLAAWTGVLGAALLMALAAVAFDTAFGPAAIGAVGAMVLVGIEAASPTATLGNWRVSSVALIDVALMWLTLSWIVSL
jgi:hypothetical protein